MALHDAPINTPLVDDTGTVSRQWVDWFVLAKTYIDGTGSDTDFSVVSSLQAGGAGALGLQYKTRTLTLSGGSITTVGSESDWNDL